jgi:hypothetical protein
MFRALLAHSQKAALGILRACNVSWLGHDWTSFVAQQWMVLPSRRTFICLSVKFDHACRVRPFSTCSHILFLLVATFYLIIKELQDLYTHYTTFWEFTSSIAGKGRLYPAYSLSGSEGEADSPTHHYRSLRRQQQQQHPYQQHTYQQPFQHQYQQPQQQQLQQHSAGLSDTPTSENASDATLTDSELALARDSTLLVHNGKTACFQLVLVLCGRSLDGHSDAIRLVSVSFWYSGFAHIRPYSKIFRTSAAIYTAVVVARSTGP